MSSLTRVIAGALAALCAALLLSACGGDDRYDGQAAGARSPESWRPWVLRSAGAIRVPAPRSGAPGEAVPQDGRRTVTPWLDQAMLLVSRRPKDPVTASRNYALVAVAMHDAAVAAAYWQRRHGAGHPSTAAAMTGAATRVLAYAFPEHPAAQLEVDAAAAVRRLVARGESREATAAGLRLGHEVAAAVIELARRDGSDRRWDGRRPRERGSWQPPPGSAARPVAPMGGTWRTWVLRSGSELRPPPPPPYGSRRFLDEVKAVVDTDRRLTAEQKRIARFWAGGEGTELPPGRWIVVTLEYLRQRPPVSDAHAARIFGLLAVAMADAGVAAWDTKYAYWVTRPMNAVRDLGVDRDWKPYLDTPFFPAYVSGHAAYSGAAAEVLAHLYPRDAALWRRRAREAADSRVYGGIHYPMDGSDGLVMGREVGRRVVARARADEGGR